VAMGRGLPAPRFRWVPFDDALLTPVASTAVEETPDRKAFYAAEAKILKKYMTEAGASAPPATLEEYVAKVVLPTLESQKKAGAVAVKFEAAYLRTLDFALPREAEARRVYAKYAKAGVPSKEEVLALQDYLFRVMAREAGRLGLAVHLHTGTGCGTYFDVMGANPGNLESVLDDATLRKTTFVLIHGGSGPWTKVAAFLMSKPNVYVDFSEQDAISPPWMLARVIREWLEWYPQKVLYGTDLSPGPPEVDWDVVGYVTNGTARQALAVALTGMVHDGDITRGRGTSNPEPEEVRLDGRGGRTRRHPGRRAEPTACRFREPFRWEDGTVTGSRGRRRQSGPRTRACASPSPPGFHRRQAP
jgi:hypothetical protein